jgi:CheY-like chemotaxis protein
MSEHKQVLVVDDNRDAADTLAVLLRHHGYIVQVAYSGAKAIEVAREQRPMVVLLDLGMPAMDGYAVARQLRQQPETKDVLIIAATGYGLAGDRARSIAAGVDLHLLKPVRHDELLEVLRANNGN